MIDMAGGIISKLKYLDPFTYVDILLDKIKPRAQRNKYLDWLIYLAFAAIFAYALLFILGLILGTSAPGVIVLSGSMEPSFYRGDIIILQGADAQNIKGQDVYFPGISTLKGKMLKEIAEVDYEKQKIIFANGAEVSINKEGDVIVYNSSYYPEPIIHRVIAKVHVSDGTYFITKGDNPKTNWFVDQACGNVVFGYVPGTDIIAITSIESACITPYLPSEKEIEGKMIGKIPFLGWVKLIPFDEIPKLLGLKK